MTDRLLISWTLIAVAVGTLVLAAVGPSYNLFTTTVAGETAVLGAFLLAMGYLIGALERAHPGGPVTPGGREGLTERTARALIGGVITACVFLGFYRWMDFGYDLSERRVDEVARAMGWPPFSPAPELIVQSRPWLLQLVPEFLLTGAVIGMLIGHVLPLWRRLWRYVARPSGPLRALDTIWISYPSFGLLSGVSLGAIFNVFIFAKSDGRPFLRLLTAVAAASVSIVGFVVLETHQNKDKIKTPMIYDLVSVAVGAFVVAAVVFMADQGFHLSEWAYLHFYSAWDTRFNQLRVTPFVLLVAAAYGGILGVVVMTVVAGYAFVRSLHTSKRTLEIID